MQEEISKLSSRKPCLASVVVGDAPDSIWYVKNQARAAKKIGMEYQLKQLNESTSTQELIVTIETLSNNSMVDGIILQQPLPSSLNTNEIRSHIPFEKDVDSLNPLSAGRLFQRLSSFIPPTPLAVMELLDYYNVSLEGKDAVVIGRSNIVGKPLAMLLLNKNATVTMCHSKTSDLATKCRQADILVAAVGSPHFVTKDMIKPGAVVVDVGINVVDDTITGDVDFDACKEVASMISPVPGGVGSLTTTLLLRNTLQAFKNDL